MAKLLLFSVTVAGCWGKVHGKKQQLAIQEGLFEKTRATMTSFETRLFVAWTSVLFSSWPLGKDFISYLKAARQAGSNTKKQMAPAFEENRKLQGVVNVNLSFIRSVPVRG